MSKQDPFGSRPEDDQSSQSEIPRPDQKDDVDERDARPNDDPLDVQKTQPMRFPINEASEAAGAAGSVTAVDHERMALLRRLTPTELTVLRHRCAGATTTQIAAYLGMSQADAALHVGNLLDKLGVTYGREGTSLSRLMAFCPLAEQLRSTGGEIRDFADPPAGQPSQRAEELTASDDEALLAQNASGALPLPQDRGVGQGWIIGGVLAFVLIIGLFALFLFTRDDNEADDGLASEPTIEVAPTETPEPEETPEVPTATAVPDEPTATPEPVPTETEVPPTETPEPTPTAVEPTPTPEPLPTATELVPTPGPPQGIVAYEADWSAGAGEWALTPGWEIDEGVLTSSGSGIASLASPFQPDQPDYAIEIEMSISGVTDCEEAAGIFARISEVPGLPDEVLAGYAGSVCADQWRIDVVGQAGRETLASDDFTVDDEFHRYRLELEGNEIRFFIDDEYVGEASDDQWDMPGEVGIYRDGDLDVVVRSFRVYLFDDAG